MSDGICPKCKTPSLPRGANRVTGVCWFCEFSRANILPLTEQQRELIALTWEDRAT
jgi:hypothetical protein